MRRERRRRREQQHVIVVGADEGVDGDQAVAAGTVFHDHRLAPALAKTIRQQPRADIGAAARPERDDEFDWPRRPIGRRCGGGDKQGGHSSDDNGGEGGQGAKVHDPLSFAFVAARLRTVRAKF